ncbi:hypothetical protein M6B38_188320 [Iris pallida]|uniref:Uncharacterized protein n=1 Tax=Iris pallida TaxID=29817 RepID=A0AAX6EHR1_IRIPA|nr:hypothetical protein M6B38_188320 [Iris pallida]
MCSISKFEGRHQFHHIFHEDLPYSSQEDIEKPNLIDEEDCGSGGLVVI